MAFGSDDWDGTETYSDAGGDPSGYRAALEEVRAKRLAALEAERSALLSQIEAVESRPENGVHDDMDKALEIQKLQQSVRELDLARGLLERSDRKSETEQRLEEDGPGGHLVTVTLSAFAWGQVLEALSHLVALRGSFFSQGMAANLWDLIASQVNGSPIKIHRWWNDLPEEEPKPETRKKVLGIF